MIHLYIRLLLKIYENKPKSNNSVWVFIKRPLRRKRIYYRNCAMIDKSDIVIFYAEDRENSGDYKALKYAKQKKKLYFNLIN